MSVDILGTSCDQCRSMVQYSFTSTETRRLRRTDISGPAGTATSTLTQLLNYDAGIENGGSSIEKYGIGGPEFGIKEEFVTEKGRQLFHACALLLSTAQPTDWH